MEERRASPFTEQLSLFMLRVAALGAFLVLFDPKFTFEILGQVVQIGGDGFSADLKGAVISAILIGGWTAVKEYWLGSSVGNVKSAEVMQRIAESAPTTSAAAVAAATGVGAAVLVSAVDARKILIGRGASAEDVAKLTDSDAVRQATEVPSSTIKGV